MKQKLLNDILYVYSLEPYEITEGTTASIIFVQEELFEEYKALNPSLTQLAKKNYNVLTTKEPEWNKYIHMDDEGDDPEPFPIIKVDPTLEWSEVIATAQIGEENTYPTLINPDNLPVVYNTDESSVATINQEGVVTLVGEGTVTISAYFDGNENYNARTATYSLSVLAEEVEPALPGYAFVNTKPTAETLDSIISLNASKPTSVETIDMTHLSGPTSMYLVCPQSWEVLDVQSDLFTSPVIVDTANGGEIGFWIDEDTPTITVDNVVYRVFGIDLGKGTFTIQFN